MEKLKYLFVFVSLFLKGAESYFITVSSFFTFTFSYSFGDNYLHIALLLISKEYVIEFRNLLTKLFTRLEYETSFLTEECLIEKLTRWMPMPKNVFLIE